ncbi:MAG TPA: D-sedoheptulose 7-phosphate isomerase [Flavisolibacter sp.]|jgi:D-sedoheptulose 7-phosphate isomerase|nr:D-sedoheptulose 7-phosphate isomerase [Flavisolibacter sp.]
MKKIKEIITASISTKQQVLQDDELIGTIAAITGKLTDALQAGKRIYFCGNGGSAADAQHLAAEFTGRYYINRKAVPAEALHCNSSYLTAVANDYSYDVVYARLVEGICQQGDVLIGLSTSGNSANIVKAFESARSMGVTTIAFTGITGGILKGLSDYLVNVPSTDTPRIQESHIMIGHIICQLVEEKIFLTTSDNIK